MLKISSGKLRRHRIKVPVSKGVRPTQTKLRLHIFNYLADFIENAKVLDLFAGSGAFGIEALSHGAAWTTFVDRVSRAVFTIERNLEKLNLKQKARVVKMDALQFLVRAKKKKDLYDIIFIDPPFDKLLKMDTKVRESYLLELLDRAYAILNPKSVIILKMHKKIKVPIPKNLLVFHTKTFGINRLYYLLDKRYVREVS